MYYCQGLLFIVMVQCSLLACTSASTRSSTNNLLTRQTNLSSQQRQTIITTAKQMLGVAYHYGGSSPKSGFDCSGLVYYTHKKAGISVARTTTGQMQTSHHIYKSALRAGDLVFFAIDHISVSHVGIYIGNNQFIHAPSTGKHVKITSLENRYWRSRFIVGGRISDLSNN